MNGTRQAVWEETFTIRHTEVTREGAVRIDTIFDYMQEAAANHAANLGCGLAALEARDDVGAVAPETFDPPHAAPRGGRDGFHMAVRSRETVCHA